MLTAGASLLFPFAFTICAGCRFFLYDLARFLIPSEPNSLYMFITRALNRSRSFIGNATESSNSSLKMSAHVSGTFLSPRTPLFTRNTAGTTPIIAYLFLGSLKSILSLQKSLFISSRYVSNIPSSMKCPIRSLSKNSSNPAERRTSDTLSASPVFTLSTTQSSPKFAD